MPIFEVTLHWRHGKTHAVDRCAVEAKTALAARKLAERAWKSDYVDFTDIRLYSVAAEARREPLIRRFYVNIFPRSGSDLSAKTFFVVARDQVEAKKQAKSLWDEAKMGRAGGVYCDEARFSLDIA